MTACTCALCDMARVMWDSLDTSAPARRGYDVTLEIDAETRRLSRSARAEQRSAGYGGLRVDELGYDAAGTYYPSLDGGGQ